MSYNSIENPYHNMRKVGDHLKNELQSISWPLHPCTHKGTQKPSVFAYMHMPKLYHMKIKTLYMKNNGGKAENITWEK